MDRTITGTTRLLAVIGHPITHSLSPQMMNYACSLLGLDFVYTAFDIMQENVPAALDAMRTLGIRGFNVTMPCKTIAFECADRLSPAARIVGACNTLINDDFITIIFSKIICSNFSCNFIYSNLCGFTRTIIIIIPSIAYLSFISTYW